MNPIDRFELERQLRGFAGKTVYLHVEVVPGGAFVRNVQAAVTETHLAGSGPFRVALRLAGDGWVRAEGLTHALHDAEGRLTIAGHDDRGRLTTGLSLSERPFPA